MIVSLLIARFDLRRGYPMPPTKSKNVADNKKTATEGRRFSFRRLAGMSDLRSAAHCPANRLATRRCPAGSRFLRSYRLLGRSFLYNRFLLRNHLAGDGFLKCRFLGGSLSLYSGSGRHNMGYRMLGMTLTTRAR